MKRLKMLQVVGVLVLSLRTAPLAQAQLYVGVLGGVATLSGDARSLLNPGSTAFSSYDPKNGGAVEVFVGRHFSDYFAVQGNYIWNVNRLTLTSAAFNNGTQQGYQETRQSSQQSLIGDLLVYFRNRDSRLRPYLSGGTGLVHFTSSQERIEQALGAPVLPPQRFSANMIALHVPVGIDVRMRKGWAFRYTFSETLSKNSISDRLSPPGQHRLMNFQNLFGFVKRF
jgi:Outer membrane protein beta-barrel domain